MIARVTTLTKLDFAISPQDIDILRVSGMKWREEVLQLDGESGENEVLA